MPTTTTTTTEPALLPLMVKPKAACHLLGCSNTRLYELIASGEIPSFLDGASRKIPTDGIRKYIERLTAAGSSANTRQVQAAVETRRANRSKEVAHA